MTSSLIELKAKARRLRLERVMLAQKADIPVATEVCPPRPKANYQERIRWIKKPMKFAPATVLIAPAPPKNLRNHEYNLAFERGQARWYHLPVSSVLGYSEAQIRQVRFCALGTTAEGMGERGVHYVWRVKAVHQLPRHVLTVAQSGSLKPSESLYWLFELEDQPIVLEQPIIGFPQHFAVKLSLFSEVMSLTDWASISEVSH